MLEKRAIFYLTFNGVHQNTNGIGRQTATMIGMVERHWAQISDEFGQTAFFVVTPAPYNKKLWGISGDRPRHVRSVAQRTGGALYSLPVPDDTFWNVATWRSLCQDSAKTIKK